MSCQGQQILSPSIRGSMEDSSACVSNATVTQIRFVLSNKNKTPSMRSVMSVCCEGVPGHDTERHLLGDCFSALGTRHGMYASSHLPI